MLDRLEHDVYVALRIARHLVAAERDDLEADGESAVAAAWAELLEVLDAWCDPIGDGCPVCGFESEDCSCCDRCCAVIGLVEGDAHYALRVVRFLAGEDRAHYAMLGDHEAAAGPAAVVEELNSWLS